MGLFIRFGHRTNSVGEGLDRLTPEGELPFGWMAHNKKIIERMESELAPFRNAVDDATDPLKKYAAIKSYLLFLEDGKKHYYRISECAGKYFEEYICDTPYIDKIIKQLAELEKKLKTK
jgi:hypothetical protein